jgi:predicted XRE-type DNA-binding protein
MARKETVKIVAASAFHALGRPNADELALRAGLLAKIGQIAAQSGLSQAALGRLIGMEQPRVSALLGGKLSLFSAERLVATLNALGQDVELRVRPAKSKRGDTYLRA